MDATAVIYDLKNRKGKEKTYLIREVFGYKDFSNKKRYSYDRPGLLTRYIIQKWGKSVLIIQRTKEKVVTRILNKYKIEHKKVRIKLEQKLPPHTV